MEGTITSNYQISLNLPEVELHDLLLEIENILNNEPQDGYDQYGQLRKLHNFIITWLSNLKEMRLL